MSLGIPKTLSIGSFYVKCRSRNVLEPGTYRTVSGILLGEDGKQLITYDDPARLRWAGIGLAVQLIMVIVMCMIFSEKEENCSCMECIRRKKSTSGICSDSCADRTDPSGFYCWLY